MAEKTVGKNVEPQPLSDRALRGASTVWGGFLMCMEGLVRNWLGEG